jgi:N-acetylmuramoyl-L-alanine amidase
MASRTNITSARLSLWAATPALLLIIASHFSTPCQAVSSDNEVHLVVSGKTAPFVVPPYVASDGTVMAPVDFVRLLGADYKMGVAGSVIITSASGDSFPQTFLHVSDRLMVPLQSTASKLGASTTWTPSTQTISLRSKLEVARVDDNDVVIATSYPVYYKTQTLDNPNRLVIDLYGTDLDSPPTSIPADNANVTRIRSGQLDDQTVRLVLDLSHPTNYHVASSLQTNAIKLALDTVTTDTNPVPVIDASAPQFQPIQVATVPTPLAPTAVPAQSVPPGFVALPSLSTASSAATTASSQLTKIVNVQYKAVNSSVSQVIITTAGPINVSSDSYKSFFIDNPNRLAVDVNNSILALTATTGNVMGSLIPDVNELFRTVRWGMVGAGSQNNVRIVMDLLHPVVYTVSTENLDDNSGVQYIINIQESAATVNDSSSNSIAGKIVIVDAGHGGKDTGAPGRAGIYEKNFTLEIAKQVRDALVAAGATPIMTRSDDTFIPLDERSQLGIDSHADYFISIHCDSSGQQNSHSGDTVYYHGSVAECREMAKSIANRLAQLDISIESDGIKSDYVRFPGIGFSVLRKSPEPAVLVECGYVNDDGDAKCLQDPDAQQQLATGIVAGLRDYVASQ